MSKLKTLAAAALLVGGVSTGALAQEASYWQADANSDGYVSRDEWRDHHSPPGGAAMRADALPGQTAPDAAVAVPELSYRAADADGDGFVSSTEWDRYHDEVARSLRERGISRPEGEFSYRDADTNQDGYVSNEEWDRYHGRSPAR